MHLHYLQAVNASNASACLAVARFYETAGEQEAAGRYWKIAARAGHPEAQWRVGYACYKGTTGSSDSEDALLWISRAAKQLADVLAARATALPLMMTLRECRKILSQAAHIVGILHLDGEGTKQDSQAAITWLSIAHRCGCSDAGKILNSLFRNGQY